MRAGVGFPPEIGDVPYFRRRCGLRRCNTSAAPQPCLSPCRMLPAGDAEAPAPGRRPADFHPSIEGDAEVHLNPVMPQRPLSRLALLAATLVAVSVVLGGVLASMASAAVPGLQRVTSFSASDSLASKSVTVECPAGKQLIGTGADIGGSGFQRVVLDDIRVNSLLTRVTVTGFEIEGGTTASWELKATAVCASPLPGLQMVQATSASDSQNTKGATASCPTGKQLVGTGGEITGGLGEVVIDDVRPNPGLSRVTVTGFEDANGTAGNWHVDAYAICANPLPGLQLATQTSANDTSGKRILANCPGGTKLLDAAGEITGGLGRVGMIEMAPANPLTEGNTVAAIQMDGGAAPNWSLNAYAICATP
jgi:hypothetical protein